VEIVVNFNFVLKKNASRRNYPKIGTFLFSGTRLEKTKEKLHELTLESRFITCLNTDEKLTTTRPTE